MIGREIHDVLRRYYGNYAGNGQRCVYVEEVRIGCGYSYEEQLYDNVEQRIDAIIAMAWKSDGGPKLMAIEIKVSRSDFIKEIKTPIKRQAAMKRCNQFYFCVPEGLVKCSEIPKDCGLMCITSDKRVKYAKVAPKTECQLDESFIVSLLRTYDKHIKNMEELSKNKQEVIK